MNREQLRARVHLSGLQAYKRSTEEVELPPTQVRIGKRDPLTGKDEVVYPDGGKEIAGKRLFNSSVPEGGEIAAYRAHGNATVALDSKNHVPVTDEVVEERIPTGVSFGLLASTNNYINGNGEGVITAALIAQLLGDTSSFSPPKTQPNQVKRYVATLISPTYTPLQPIRDGLAAYGYKCEDIKISDLANQQLMSKYDVLIGRIVTLTNNGNAAVIDGAALDGVKTMLKRKKLVVVGGCGCPFGSYPLNDLLSKLGFEWRVSETRSLSEPQKPAVTYPWVVQKKGRIKESVSYTPQITDRTVFSGVAPEESIALSSNGQIMMAYSPYPKCIKWR